MTQPLVTPQHAPTRPLRLPWMAWVAGLTLAALLPVLGWELGQRYSQTELWDPLWIRAYVNRPFDTTAPGAGFWVAGYYVDYDNSSLEMVKTSAHHMDQVVIFGYGFDQKGNLIGREDQVVRGVTGRQKRVILFGNLTDGGFNKDTAHAILTDPAVQEKAIQAMLDKTLQLEGAGVQIYFENIPHGDRDAYTAFLKNLKEKLAPHKLTLSIAAAAKTRDSRDGWGGATDYAAIGQVVDHFYIMAYDEHWRGGEPGPVASLPWVEQVIRYATGVMPSQKIVLGLPFYGYDWAADPAAGTKNNKAFGSDRMARRMEEFGAKVKWDPVTGENVATYKGADGERVAWYPDQRSLDAKLRLAYQYNLKGIALWRVGFEPDAWWEQMGAFRVNPSK